MRGLRSTRSRARRQLSGFEYLCCEHNEQKYNIGRALIFAKVTDVHLIAGEGAVQMRKNITDVDQHSCQSSAVLDRLLGEEQVGSSLTSEVLIQPTWL